MNSIVFPCFPILFLTKFVLSVRPSIASIIRNHPTDLLLQNADKNAYEKIAILRRYADGYAATSLTLHPSVCFFFFFGFFSRTFTISRIAGKGEGYLFNSSLILPPASGTRTGKPWFPSACVFFHLYVVETVQNWWHLFKNYLRIFKNYLFCSNTFDFSDET